LGMPIARETRMVEIAGLERPSRRDVPVSFDRSRAPIPLACRPGADCVGS